MPSPLHGRGKQYGVGYLAIPLNTGPDLLRQVNDRLVQRPEGVRPQRRELLQDRDRVQRSDGMAHPDGLQEIRTNPASVKAQVAQPFFL